LVICAAVIIVGAILVFHTEVTTGTRVLKTDPTAALLVFCATLTGFFRGSSCVVRVCAIQLHLSGAKGDPLATGTLHTLAIRRAFATHGSRLAQSSEPRGIDETDGLFGAVFLNSTQLFALCVRWWLDDGFVPFTGFIVCAAITCIRVRFRRFSCIMEFCVGFAGFFWRVGIGSTGFANAEKPLKAMGGRTAGGASFPVSTEAIKTFVTFVAIGVSLTGTAGTGGSASSHPEAHEKNQSKAQPPQHRFFDLLHSTTHG
jgi:hypothetical protein